MTHPLLTPQSAAAPAPAPSPDAIPDVAGPWSPWNPWTITPPGGSYALPVGARWWALLPCAGTGTRALPPGQAAASALPKQYLHVAGQPLVLHTLAALAGVGRLAGTLVAVAAGDHFLDAYPGKGFFTVECGGPTRADTVLGGLRALLQRGAQAQDWVLVHDAARCLVTPEQIDALIDACLGDDVGGLLAHKLADTLKSAIAGPGGIRVASTASG